MTWYASVINDNYFTISSTAVWPTGTPVTSGGGNLLRAVAGEGGKTTESFYVEFRCSNRIVPVDFEYTLAR